MKKLRLREIKAELCWLGFGPESVWLQSLRSFHSIPAETYPGKEGMIQGSIHGSSFSHLPPPSLQPEEGSGSKMQPGLWVPEWGGLHGPAVDDPLWVPRWGTCARWGRGSQAYECGSWSCGGSSWCCLEANPLSRGAGDSFFFNP